MDTINHYQTHHASKMDKPVHFPIIFPFPNYMTWATSIRRSELCPSSDKLTMQLTHERKNTTRPDNTMTQSKEMPIVVVSALYTCRAFLPVVRKRWFRLITILFGLLLPILDYASDYMTAGILFKKYFSFYLILLTVSVAY